MTITDAFKTFNNELLFKREQRSLIGDRKTEIAKAVNRVFRDYPYDAYTKYVGSYGRETANGTVSDIDMLMILPYDTYVRYNNYQSNGQSQLLQDVKNAITGHYSTTKKKGDGQVVDVWFSDGMSFEVVPCFTNKDGSYTFPDSNNGGRWVVTNPQPEIDYIAKADAACNNNLRNLCRMVRAWKEQNNVPIKSCLIDTLVCRFLESWEHRDKSYLYYDWMSRDFFKFLSEQEEGKTLWRMVGSQQWIYNPDNFRNKAKKAYELALEAIEADNKKYEWTRNNKWREIYGNRFPTSNLL